MRRNGADPTFSAPDPALLSWHAAARPTQASPAPAKLTPVQQREQAILVARSFKDQYLSGIAYLEDRGTTIAIVRPIHRHKGNPCGPSRQCECNSPRVVIASLITANRSLAATGGRRVRSPPHPVADRRFVA